MKKYLTILGILALGVFAASCNKNKEAQPVAIDIQLTSDGTDFAVEGVKVSLSDAAASFTLEASTDAKGVATFSVKPGAYTAQATYVTSENGQRLAYNGSNNNIMVVEASTKPYSLPLQKVVSQQIVIKEVYSTGCPKEPSGSYSDDAYIILYNNSEFEADATDVVFGMLFPYNGHGTNKFYTDGALLYENLSWVPAASALWSFNTTVKIPAYSQIVIVLYGAIDHTATQPASVNLADASYYWMSKNDQFKATKYQAGNVVPETNYLTCTPFNSGTAWLFSNSAPSLFIGKMPKADVEALVKNTDDYDKTQGTSAAQVAVKFPQDKIIGALEVWSSANIEKSNLRFPASLNTGYIAIANNKGYTVYRNVDKEATEALPENEGKLVYNYAGGTEDVEGSTDPSGIDAEASIAAGAHIIYKQTNSSANDFHIRKVSSLKK